MQTTEVAAPAPKTLYERMFDGQIPVHKLYEDTENGFLAFLDIKPATKGHTLVVPREPVDKIYDMSAARSIQLSQLTQVISRHLQKQLSPLRVTEHVYGFQVPHAHRMLVPSYERGDVAFLNDPKRMEQEVDNEALGELADYLRFSPDEQENTREYLRYLGGIVTDCT